MDVYLSLKNPSKRRHVLSQWEYPSIAWTLSTISIITKLHEQKKEIPESDQPRNQYFRVAVHENTLYS